MDEPTLRRILREELKAHDDRKRRASNKRAERAAKGQTGSPLVATRRRQAGDGVATARRRTGDKVATSPVRDACDRFLEAWLKYGHPGTKLDDKRRGMIKRHLASGYTADDLVAAAHGIHKSPWHNGVNPGGKKYLTIEHCIRGAKEVDTFRELVREQHKTQNQIAAEAAVASIEREEEEDEGRQGRTREAAGGNGRDDGDDSLAGIFEAGRWGSPERADPGGG